MFKQMEPSKTFKQGDWRGGYVLGYKGKHKNEDIILQEIDQHADKDNLSKKYFYKESEK